MDKFMTIDEEAKEAMSYRVGEEHDERRAKRRRLLLRADEVEEYRQERLMHAMRERGEMLGELIKDPPDVKYGPCDLKRYGRSGRVVAGWKCSACMRKRISRVVAEQSWRLKKEMTFQIVRMNLHPETLMSTMEERRVLSEKIYRKLNRRYSLDRYVMGIIASFLEDDRTWEVAWDELETTRCKNKFAVRK